MNSKSIQFNVGSVIIPIPERIIHRLPFIKALTESDDIKANQCPILTIDLDQKTLSPEFLITIIKYLNNNLKLDFLKYKLQKMFEESFILQSLLFLCDSQLIDEYYYPKIVINSSLCTVVNNISWSPQWENLHNCKVAYIRDIAKSFQVMYDSKSLSFDRLLVILYVIKLDDFIFQYKSNPSPDYRCGNLKTDFFVII